MELLLSIILVSAAYVGLGRAVGRKLGNTSSNRQVLSWAYGGSVGFVLSCWLAYTLGGWVFRFPLLFITVFIGSGWLAGLRRRLGWVAAPLRGWAALHSWSTLPSAAVLALCWGIGLGDKPLYGDDTAAVDISEDFHLSDDRSWTLTFYQRNGLFEAKMGQTRLAAYEQEYWRPEWWNEVTWVYFDAQAGNTTVHRCCGASPTVISYRTQ